MLAALASPVHFPGIEVTVSKKNNSKLFPFCDVYPFLGAKQFVKL
jgi:hypothetical protein